MRLSIPRGVGGFGPLDNLGGSGGGSASPDSGVPEETVASDDAYEVSALADTTISAPGLLANDTLGDAELMAETLETRLGGSVTIAADGGFVYSPPASPGALPRVDNFTYTLRSEAGDASAVVALTLVAPPEASDDELGTLPNETLVLDPPGVLANDQPNGAKITAYDAASSEGGQVLLEGSGKLTYSPPSDFAGEDSFSYTLTNVSGSATAVVRITVDEEPVAAEDHYIGSKGQPLDSPHSLLANDARGAPEATLVSFGGGSLGGSAADHAAGTTASVGGSQLIVGANGSFTFTPEVSFVGPFEFFYTLQNSGGSSEGRVVIDVHEAPLAGDDVYDVLAGNTLSVAANASNALFANDVGTPAPVVTSFGAGSLGGTVADHAAGSTATFAGGALTVNADGSFTFVADASASGDYTFDYQVENAAGQDEGNVRITVAHAPEITSDDTLTLRAGTDANLPFELTATGTPAPVISVDGVLPEGVVFEDGSLTGTPDSESAGEYDITVTASNGLDPDAVQTLTITVQTEALISGAPTATFTVGIAGSYEPLVIGVPAPVLTLDGDLPDGLSFDETGAITGTPADGAGGVYPLSISADNGLDEDSILLVTLEVLEAPELSSADNATFVVGEAGSFEVLTTGHPARTVSVSGSLPPGVSFNAASATLSGTPEPGSGGSHDLTVQASNGVESAASQSFTLTVNEAPSLSGAASATFRVGESGSYTLTSSGFPAPTLSVDGALPSGVTFDPQTGTLSGEPAPGTGGSYSLTFSASNGIGSDASSPLTLNIDEGSSITSANSTTFTVGTAGSFTVTATGTPAPTLSLTSGALPGGVTFNPATGVLAGTPTAGTGGEHPLTFTASNGVGSEGVQGFTLTITEAPALSGASTTTFTVGTNGSYVVGVVGFPLPQLTIDGTLPDGLSFQPLTGTVSGTPEPGQGGSYSVTINASNGVGSDASLALTLNVEEGPELTSPDEINFLAGTPDSFVVTATGTPEPTLELAETLPLGLTFTPETGVLEGTPAPGTGGEYTLTFSADNGVRDAAIQSATLTIEEAPGLVGAASATFVVGNAGTHSVTRTGFPVPTLGISGTLPTGVTFDAQTGTLSGTPGAGAAGSYNVTISATNGVGSAASLPVAIQVNEAPSFSSASSTTFTVGTAGSFTVTATGTPAPSFGVTGSLPGGVTLNASTGVLSGTPLPGSGGEHSVTLSASNGLEPAASQSFTLVVHEAPSISGTPPATLDANSPFVHAFSASGFPAATFSVVAGTLPTGLTLGGDGTLSGTPTVVGSFPDITVRATNAVGSSDLTFSITVLNPVQPPSATGEAFQVTGNVPIEVTSSVLENDTLNTATIVGYGPSTGDAASTAPGAALPTIQGGVVLLQADGTFTYDPPAGVTGSDSFAYTLSNSDGSSVAQVSLTISNRIWFVDSSAPANGTGSLSSPFRDVTDVTSTSSGDVIYVRDRGTTYGNKALSPGQRLIGSGVAAIAHLGFTLAPFSRTSELSTTPTNATMRTLTLATGTYVRGMNLSPSVGAKGLVGSSASGVDVSGMSIGANGAPAVDLSSVAGTVSLTQASANGGVNGILLNDTTGSFTVTGDGSGARNGSGGTIQSTSGNGIELTNAQNVTLRSMNLQSISSAALFGNGGVVNLTLQGLQVSNIGTALDFNASVSPNSNLSGAVSITGSAFSNATGNIFALENLSGTLSSLTVANNTFSSSAFTGLELLILDDATLNNGSITGNTFTDVGTGANTSAVFVSVARALSAASTPFARVDVENNTITGTNNAGIRLRVQDSNGTLHTRVRNNSVAAPTATSSFAQSIRIESGSGTGDSTVCAEISGNSAGFTNPVASDANAGIALRRQSGTGGNGDVFGIVGLPAGSLACPRTGTSTCAGTPLVENIVGFQNPDSTGNAANGNLKAYLASSLSGFSSCSL